MFSADGHTGDGALELPRRVVLGRETLPAVLGRPVNAGVPRLVQSLLPVDRRVDEVGRADRAVVAWGTRTGWRPATDGRCAGTRRPRAASRLATLGGEAGQSHRRGATQTRMDFELPAELTDYLAELDAFIEREIVPLEETDDNMRFFDHRREDARTDWERGGLPNEEWEALLFEARRRADAAGHYRYPFPEEYGGRDGTNLGMAVIREHLARKGLGLHNDLQNEHSIVGNNVGLLLMLEYGTDEQKSASGSTRWPRDAAGSRSASPSRPTVRTRPTWRPPRSATATIGSSTVRRPGTPASIGLL